MSARISPIQPATINNSIWFWRAFYYVDKASNQIPSFHHWSEVVPLALNGLGPYVNEIGHNKWIEYSPNTHWHSYSSCSVGHSLLTKHLCRQFSIYMIICQHQYYIQLIKCMNPLAIDLDCFFPSLSSGVSNKSDAKFFE